MGERRLTVRDRIIVHLAGFSRYAEEYECPMEMSQSGIAESIGKSRAHTTLELNRMKEAGLLTERLARVKGAKSKRKTYSLTSQALALEKSITAYVESLEILIGEDEPMNGRQAATFIMEKNHISRPMAYDLILSSDGKVNLPNIQNNTDDQPNFIEPEIKAASSPKESGSGLESFIIKSNNLSKAGQYQEALQLLEQASNSFNNDSNFWRVHYSRASIFRKRGNFPGALKEINQSLTLVDQELPRARCQMEKAMILYGTGKKDKSLKILEEASTCFLNNNCPVDLIRCGINQGMILKGMGDDDSAFEILENSMVLAEKNGIDRLQAYSIVNLTDILNKQSQYDRSCKLAGKACDIFGALNEPIMLAAARFNQGAALAGLGKYKEAVKSLDSAIEILENNDMLASRIEWLEKYSEILEQMGQPDKAKQVLAKI